jgi:hypothetical protein
MPGGTGLDEAALVVYAELAAVNVAEVDLHSGKFAAKSLQEPIHFAPDELNHPSIYRDAFVAIDLNPHAILCSPPSLRAVKDFFEVWFEAGIDDSIYRVI